MSINITISNRKSNTSTKESTVTINEYWKILILDAIAIIGAMGNTVLGPLLWLHFGYPVIALFWFILGVIAVVRIISSLENNMGKLT